MSGKPEDDRHPGQASVPKPPTREGVEEISRAQEYLTDDWTGDGGKPKDTGKGADKESASSL